jgi:hypothetical protein
MQIPTLPKPQTRQGWLRLESLKIKRLINLARGRDGDDGELPSDDVWLPYYNNILTAIRRGELAATRLPGQPESFYSVTLFEFWRFVATREGDWEWAREFCKEWAIGCGVIFQTAATAASSDSTAQAQSIDTKDATSPNVGPIEPAVTIPTSPASTRRGRQPSKQDDERTRQKILAHIREAQRRWPSRNKLPLVSGKPSMRQAALVLAECSEIAKEDRLTAGPIRAILAGQYGPMRRLNIAPPWASHRRRSSGL